MPTPTNPYGPKRDTVENEHSFCCDAPGCNVGLVMIAPDGWPLTWVFDAATVEGWTVAWPHGADAPFVYCPAHQSYKGCNPQGESLPGSSTWIGDLRGPK